MKPWPSCKMLPFRAHTTMCSWGQTQAARSKATTLKPWPPGRRSRPVSGHYVHTNHCVFDANCAIERPRKAYSLASTHARLDQAEQFMTGHHGSITPDTLIELTRFHVEGEPSVCAHATPDYHIESSGACIMSPATRELWAVWGLPCRNEYERFVVERATAMTRG